MALICPVLYLRKIVLSRICLVSLNSILFLTLFERERERERERENFFLFNDTLNTFYLRLYGVRHMVKDHSDSEKGNPLSPHRLLLSLN